MVRQFHIAHIIPHPKFHGLKGYSEVIETLAWGLTALGHEVSIGLNQFSTDATNIVFGFQMLKEQHLNELPPETIIYNFEQISGIALSELKPAYAIAAKRLRVWEYSQFNLPVWESLNPDHPVTHVPVGWAPILSKIAETDLEDIDVLFYGMTGKPRFKVFDELCHRGVTCLFACGLYGRARDALIARSKIILNVNLLEHSGIFEVVRVSYLLANKKAVVADKRPTTLIEPDLLTAVHFVPLEKIGEECVRLLKNDAERKHLENRGFEAICQRDIRTILLAVLEN